MKPQSKAFLLQAEIPFENAGTGITRQVMGFNKDIMMVRVLFEKGATGKAHTHQHIQTTYVASGKFEITIDGRKQMLNAGDGFFVPANVLHGAECIEAGELVDVFTPMRVDFLK